MPYKLPSSKRYVNRNNPITLLRRLRRKMRANYGHNTVAGQLSEISDDLGKVVAGEFDAIASAATSSEPTDSGFTGVFMSGDPKTFTEGDFNVGGVSAGALQVGFNTAGELLAAVGAWVLSATGLLITGVQFIINHTATVGAYDRRMRQGFQEVSSKPVYVVEFIDDAAGTNLITTNSDFETGSLATGYSTTTGWAINSSDPYAGTYAAATSNVSGFPLTTNKYATTAGNSYRFGVFQKSTTVGCPAALIEVKWYNGVPTLLQTDIVTNAAPTGAYVEAAVTIVAPSGSTQFEIAITPPLDDNYLVDNLTAALVSNYAAVRLSDTGIDLIDETQTVNFAAGVMTIPEISAPSTPASGYSAIYGDTNGVIHHKNDAGDDLVLHNLYGKRQVENLANEFWNTGGQPSWGSTAIGAGTQAVIASEASHPGIVRITQNGANTGFAWTQASAPTTSFLLGGGEVFECIFRLQNTTNCVYRLGFQDSVTTAAPTDAVYIHIAGTTADGRTYNNTATSTTGTNYTVSAGTWYRAKVVVNSTSLVTFSILSMAGASLWSNTLTTNIPSAAGRETGMAALGYKTTAGTVDLIDLDWANEYNLTTLTR